MIKTDAFRIKLFMALLMVADHIYMIPGIVPVEMQSVLHLLTRCVSAWFAFAAVEGFIHTHSRAAYNIRLYVWAVIMHAGNTILNMLFQDKGVSVSNNIFLTLAAGVTVLGLIWMRIPESAEPQKRAAARIAGYISAAAVYAAAAVFSEGGYLIIPFMVVTYGFRNRPALRNIIYAAMSAGLLYMNITALGQYGDIADKADMLMFNSDWFFISVLPFIYMYNGERGRNDRFSKYFFYVFYPLHLWLITAAAYMVK